MFESREAVTRPPARCWTIGVALTIAITPSARGQASETQSGGEEAAILTHVRQLTDPGMGFEKAGEAYFSPDGERVIFQAVPQGGKQYQIYTIGSAGGSPSLVSTGKGACTCAYFRPDGKKILFASSHEDPRIADPSIEFPVPGYKREGSKYEWDFNPFMDLYEANPDGSDLRPLTRAQGYDAEGAYSRDGSKIAFASDRDGSMNLYAMNADGSDVRQITHTTNCYNGGPFFSPDGKRIIFRADRKKRDYLQIYLINADGSEERLLTDNDAVNWGPFWHPAGKVIAYATSVHGHTNYEVYLMNVDHGAQKRATYHPGFDGLPVFSPDGRQMMWTSKRGPDNTSQVFLADFTMPAGLE